MVCRLRQETKTMIQISLMTYKLCRKLATNIFKNMYAMFLTTQISIINLLLTFLSTMLLPGCLRFPTKQRYKGTNGC